MIIIAYFFVKSKRFLKNLNGDDYCMTQKVDPSVVGAHYETLGKTQRVSFAKIKQLQEVPNLIAIQLQS